MHKGYALPEQGRNTRQKNAIRQAFQSAGRPLSPDEALRAAQHHVAGLSIATVYRNIGALLEKRWLTPVQLPGEATRYEVAGKTHHHHFQCTACRRVYELEGCTFPEPPALPTGFHATGHDLFLFGTCAACAHLS